MASKNLLPVTALCSALATGMPVAALATPAVDIPLPAVNCLATNQMSTIARQRFSLAPGKHFGLGVPPSLHEQLDSRGYRALEHSGRPPNGMHYLHMARSCN